MLLCTNDWDIDAITVPRNDDPEWVMINHGVVHCLYTTVSPKLLDVIMQPEYIDTEYHVRSR